MPATQASLDDSEGQPAFGPDGSVYIPECNGGANFLDNCRILRVGADGIVTTIAGGVACGHTGDGGPASQAQLFQVTSVARGADGSLYVAEPFAHFVRKISPDGTIGTIAGTGVRAGTGDGGPASQAALDIPWNVAVGPDSSVYIAENGGRVRRIAPDGTISTFAGGGNLSPEQVPATRAQLVSPRSVAVGPDGSVYVVASGRALRVTHDGIIHVIAGTGFGGFTGDGGPATQATFGDNVTGVAVGPEGSVYIADWRNRVVRIVTPDGTINSIVGGGGTYEKRGNNGPATQAYLYGINGAGVGPDGNVYIPATGEVRRVGPALPGLSVAANAIPNESGTEVYVFDGQGRHLRTLDALTGALRLQFSYDAAGRLLSVVDGDGNATTVERDSAGAPTAILSPYGQRTALSLDANGALASLTNPASERTQFTTTAEGLLTSHTDPPGGGHIVSITSALGLTTTYSVAQIATGGQHYVTTFPEGSRTDAIVGTDGTQTITSADGTRVQSVLAPDPNSNSYRQRPGDDHGARRRVADRDQHDPRRKALDVHARRARPADPEPGWWTGAGDNRLRCTRPGNVHHLGHGRELADNDVRLHCVGAQQWLVVERGRPAAAYGRAGVRLRAGACGWSWTPVLGRSPSDWITTRSATSPRTAPPGSSPSALPVDCTTRTPGSRTSARVSTTPKRAAGPPAIQSCSRLAMPTCTPMLATTRPTESIAAASTIRAGWARRP